MKNVLILSGPTHEYFDPVRFIGNASSGKMGKALAEEACRRGMKVRFISGPVPDINIPDGIELVKTTRTEEMLNAAQKEFPNSDIIIFAAAVADFQPVEKSETKRPKTGGPISIDLKPTPDIAAALCADKRENQLTIGFALQTHDGEKKAKEKRIKKNLNAIVLNTPATLGAEDGLFTWIDSVTTESWGRLSKTECARRIFDRALT